jgi:uncharacterized protein YjiK
MPYYLCFTFLLFFSFLPHICPNIVPSNKPKQPVFPYNLQHPSQTYTLPKTLNEISGLSAFNDDLVFCVQDEKGVLYSYNLDQQKITNSYKFAEKGDYEGLCLQNDNVWIVRSDGTLFKIKNFTNTDKKTSVKTYKTKLKQQHNIEGLCFDAHQNRLLLAAKGNNETDSQTKSIYAFDLNNKNLQKTPIITLNISDIEAMTYQKDSRNFAPSGIAIHPINQHIYILASQGKALAVFTPKGQLTHLVKLDTSLFQQPEGITFLPNGKLLIANEAKNQKATILQFNTF